MTAITKASAKTYFITGAQPTQAQFGDLIDSYQDANGLLLALASAASGTLEVQGAAIVTANPTGIFGRVMLAAATTAKAIDALGVANMTTLADASAVSWDVSQYPAAQLTVAGVGRVITLSNVSAGHSYALKLIQDGTGNRVVSWSGNVKWAGGAAFTLSTAAASHDVIVFVSFDNTRVEAVGNRGFA